MSIIRIVLNYILRASEYDLVKTRGDVLYDAYLTNTRDIEELTKERDYLDGRCAALENDLVLDDVISKLEKVQTRLADYENLARDFVEYKAPDHICRMHFEMMLKESEGE